MDKETLSNYGWIVICVLVLAVMLALSSPFGSFVATGVKSTTQGLFDTNQKALNTTGLVSVEGQDFDGSIFRNATIPNGGTYKSGSKTLLAGEKFPDAPATGDTYEEGDYIYKYNYSYTVGALNGWTSHEGNGWGVRVKDTTKTSYREIITEIAGKTVNNTNGTFGRCSFLTTAPTIPSSVTDMYRTFYNCKSLTTAPAIPNSVTNMNGTFESCTSLTTAPEIPNSVTNMSCTFYFCTSLTTAPTIPNSVTDMQSTFYYCKPLTTAPEIPSSVTNMSYIFQTCTSLTGTMTINANPTSYGGCFRGTTLPITLTGTSLKLNNIASSYSNVTVASTP